MAKKKKSIRRKFQVEMEFAIFVDGCDSEGNEFCQLGCELYKRCEYLVIDEPSHNKAFCKLCNKEELKVIKNHADNNCACLDHCTDKVIRCPKCVELFGKA